MAIKPNVNTRRDAYDADDPANYMDAANAGASSIIPWMFIGMFGVAAVIGLFVGQDSPLPKLQLIAHLSDSVAVQPSLPRAN